VPSFDVHDAAKFGWLEKNIRKMHGTVDDGRFNY